MENHNWKHAKTEKWETCEVICLKCLSRWIAVFPQEVLLKELECPNEHVGFTIKTGQSIIDNQNPDML